MGGRRLPSKIAGAEVYVCDAVELLRVGTRASKEEALRQLDKAAGFRTGARGVKGGTVSGEGGLRSLPAYVVRRVEYERVMRRANCSEMEIAAMHGEFSDCWYYGDVKDMKGGADYLMRACVCGNMFARRVLEWLAPEEARGLGGGGMVGGKEEWFRAIRMGERERAVELGRMVGGEGVRPDATMLIRMGVREQRALAANNIGWMLAHGHGVEQDVEEAICYYDMAMQWGSAAACSNKGFLLHYGADDMVPRDGNAARELYELAIERGERDHAPRNLGLLLARGGGGIRRDVAKGARWLLVGLREGDEMARERCAESLRRVVRSWRMAVWAPALRSECLAALGEGDGEDVIGAE